MRLGLGFALVCLLGTLANGFTPAYGEGHGAPVGHRHAYGKHHMNHGRGLHHGYRSMHAHGGHGAHRGHGGHGHGLHGGQGLIPGGGLHYRPPTQPAGGPVGTYAYPYYTLRGPRDFLMANPPSIGPY